jgi:GGDEF domain-containing protein
VEAASEVDGKPVGATVSAGIAISRHDATGESLEEMLDRADRALYAAKAAGRNRVRTEDAAVPTDTNIVRLA